MHSLKLAPLWLLGALGVATALALAGSLGWPFELFTHFRVQYAAAALLLAVLLAWQRRPLAAVLGVLLAAWHAWPVFAPAPAPLACSGPDLGVATVNLRYANEDRDRALEWLAARPADLVAVQESTLAWAVHLAALQPYPHRRIFTRDDPYGIGVLSRWPLESVEQLDLAGDGLPSLAGVVDVAGRRVRFLALHTRWPVLPDLARARDRALHQAAEFVRRSDLPVVVLGDLNLSPDAPGYARLLADAGLSDAMAGQGWRPTWLAGFWPLALRIDHVLVSPGLCASHAAVGPDIGSDHRPVVVRLHLQAGTTPTR